MKWQRRCFTLASVLVITILCVGCFSLAVDYSAPKALLEPHRATVASVISLLDQNNIEDARELLDDLHGAVIEARALLAGMSFAGSAETLTDPFVLPVGTYRVNVRTSGFIAVMVLSVDTTESDLLFNLFEGQATDGASTAYRSSGERIMLEFSNVSKPYQLWFEKVN